MKRRLDIQVIKPSPHMIFSCCFSITTFKLLDWLRDISYKLFLKSAICKHQLFFQMHHIFAFHVSCVRMCDFLCNFVLDGKGRRSPNTLPHTP